METLRNHNICFTGGKNMPNQTEDNCEKHAQAHLKQAETELTIARKAELAALHEMEEAEREIREAEAHREVDFTVDGEECETRRHEMTANDIIREFGKQDPANNYLVEIQGTRKESYEGRGNEKIRLRDGLCFLIISTGPKTVSACVGAAAFSEGLRGLGYEPQVLANFPNHIFFNFLVGIGRFAGQTVRLGFVVPADFPNIAPSGPHVSPHIQPIHTSNDKPHPAGGVHPSGDFQQGAGGDWQYWSRPHPDWGRSKKTVAAYMAHILGLWATQ